MRLRLYDGVAESGDGMSAKEVLRQIAGPELLARKRFVTEFLDWRRRQYAPPSPNAIKRATIRRNALDGTFVETGTYLGDTTEFATLFSKQVISLEPDPQLYAAAIERFRDRKEIRLIGSSSEEAFGPLVEQLAGSVTFWLDGHYSGAGTFLGLETTPIGSELKAIAERGSGISDMAILIDDVRCFGADGYPPLSYFVDWAKGQAMRWSIEHDIFVMHRL